MTRSAVASVLPAAVALAFVVTVPGGGVASYAVALEVGKKRITSAKARGNSNNSPSFVRSVFMGSLGSSPD